MLSLIHGPKYPTSIGMLQFGTVRSRRTVGRIVPYQDVHTCNLRGRQISTIPTISSNKPKYVLLAGIILVSSVTIYLYSQKPKNSYLSSNEAIIEKFIDVEWERLNQAFEKQNKENQKSVDANIQDPDAVTTKKVLPRYSELAWNKTLERFISNSIPIDYVHPCTEFAPNLDGKPAENLRDILNGLSGNKDVLRPNNKLNYEVFGRVIATIRHATQISIDRDVPYFSDLLMDKIREQLIAAAKDYDFYKPLQQTDSPIHPRTYLIQSLVELRFSLPDDHSVINPFWLRITGPHIPLNNFDEKCLESTIWDESEPFKGTYYYPGPFYHQSHPVVFAAFTMAITGARDPQNLRETTMNEFLCKLGAYYLNYEYGKMYSIPNLIVGGIQEKHLPEKNDMSMISAKALKFPGILKDNQFSEHSREKWFSFLLEGYYGGKNEDWNDALVCLYNQTDTSQAWKRKIDKAIKSESMLKYTLLKLQGKL